MLFGKISALFVLGTVALASAKTFTFNPKSAKASKGVYALSGSASAECSYSTTKVECIQTDLTTETTSIALDTTSNFFAIEVNAEGTYNAKLTTIDYGDAEDLHFQVIIDLGKSEYIAYEYIGYGECASDEVYGALHSTFPGTAADLINNIQSKKEASTVFKTVSTKVTYDSFVTDTNVILAELATTDVLYDGGYVTFDKKGKHVLAYDVWYEPDYFSELVNEHFLNYYAVLVDSTNDGVATALLTANKVSACPATTTAAAARR